MMMPATSVNPYTPRPATGTYSAPASLNTAVGWLGYGCTRDPRTGNLNLNLRLIESLVQYRHAVVPALYQLLNTSSNRFQVIEGLYLAQRLAEEKVYGVRNLYAAAARFNQSTDPLILTYLAGFYRKLDVPESFGPMLGRLVALSQQPYPQGQNPLEEIGGTVLQQLASRTADELARRLSTPALSTQQPANNYWYPGSQQWRA